MADVYSQIYIQIVFAVKYRQSLIRPEWEDRLYKYITGIIQTRGHKLLAIGGMPDHIHIFIGFKPVEALSDLVREIKNGSNDFIKLNQLSPTKFQWQAGYGAFSYSHSSIGNVCRYIQNQKAHHAKQTFKEEYHLLINAFEVEVGRKTFFDFFTFDEW